MESHDRTLNIRPECIRTSEWVAKLQQRFPLNDSVLLNGDDLNHLLYESVLEVVKENTRQSEVLSAGSRSTIRTGLEELLEVQRVSTISSDWDSVYWDPEDQRPDRISEAMNHIYAQLDETSQHQIMDVLNSAPEFLLEDGKIDHVRKWRQDQPILKMLETHRNSIEWNGSKFVTRSCTFYRVNFACLRRLDDAITVDVSSRSCLSLAVNVADYPPDLPVTKKKQLQTKESIEPSDVEVSDFLLDLLAKGSYLKLVDEEDVTFLHLMLANCSSVAENVDIFRLVEELLERGADLNAVDCKGASVLHYAARYSLPEEVILLLLERGADLNAVDSNDKTVLHYAARCSSSVGVIKLLLERGADVDAIDANGATVLHSAASASTCSVPVIQLLLDRGGDLQAQDKEGGSVLHWAAGFCSCVDVIKLLLDRGADVNGVDKYGTTVLHYAAVDSSTVNVVDFLLKEGADLYAVDQEGKNVLHYIRDNSSAEVVHFLRAAFHKNSAISS